MSDLKKEKFIKNKAKKLYNEWIHSDRTMSCLETIEKAIILGMDNALDKPDVYSVTEGQSSTDETGVFSVYRNGITLMARIWYGGNEELTRDEAQELAKNIISFLETKEDIE